MFFTAESMTTHPALAEAVDLIAKVAADHPEVPPVAPYADMTDRTLVTAHFEDGTVIGAGIVDADGYISSFVSTVPGVSTDILDRLIVLGGDHLVDYDLPWLKKLYRSRGFKVTHRFKWDSELAPANWPLRLGTPDYLFMRRAD